LQHLIGLSGVPAFDVNAVCAGWLFGMKIAASLVETQRGKVLLVAADKYSGILNRRDPTTVSLFGDGAGATVVEFNDDPGSGLQSLELATAGEYDDWVMVEAGGSGLSTSPDPADYQFQMNGKQVRSFVLSRLPSLMRYACARAGIGIADLGAVVCHQANVRLLEDIAKEMGIHPSLMPLTAPLFGNTGVSSLPLTLVAAQDTGKLVPGRPVALCGVGGGMSLGAGVYVP
jgi:3-oxoacyl-(acyl-carrier-protein) synthase III